MSILKGLLNLMEVDLVNIVDAILKFFQLMAGVIKPDSEYPDNLKMHLVNLLRRRKQNLEADPAAINECTMRGMLDIISYNTGDCQENILFTALKTAGITNASTVLDIWKNYQT